MLHHPVSSGTYIASQHRGGKVSMIAGSQLIADIMQKGRDDGFLVGAVPEGARSSLQ